MLTESGLIRLLQLHPEVLEVRMSICAERGSKSIHNIHQGKGLMNLVTWEATCLLDATEDKGLELPLALATNAEIPVL